MSRDRLGLLFLVLTCGAAPASSQDEYRHGRVRHLEYGVTVQRASESAAEEASFNVPFLPGDRVWTDASGRVEFQFADGSLLRLDNRSKLDYTAHEDGKIVLHLWSGGVFLRTPDARSDEFEFETPGGFVNSRGAGLIRVDVESGETRLAVLEGEAQLESGRRRVQVAAGERAYARRGEAPTDDDGRVSSDEFDRWNESRDERVTRTATSGRYLPEEVSPYADEFDNNGSWYYETEVGYVWRPVVAAGWRPYTSGHWSWTSYGWTWVPNESWGWAPFHYGRWGHSTAIGWYWIPGSTWGPAWVSWAMGSNYVGWCPLGYRDRVFSFDNGHRGNAGPHRSGTDHWSFARRADLGARDLAQRRIAVRPEEARELRVAESPHARPSRDLATIETRPNQQTARGRTRTIQTRPTPGDTVPELRSDPFTTIPAPVARRRSNKDENGRERDQQDYRRYDGDANTSAPAETAAPRLPRTWREEPATRTTRPRAETGADDQARSPAVRAPEPERATDRVRSTPRDRESSRERSRSEGETPAHPSREIMRDFFSPVSRKSSGEGSESARPRSEGAPPRSERSEPRRETQRDSHRDDARATSRQAPPPQAESSRPAPAPRPAADHATRRPKDKDKQ